MLPVAVLKQSEEELFLDVGYYFALSFREGWFVGRVTGKAWANLQPWSLGAVASLANLAVYNEIQDANSNHYLEPPKTMREVIYHTFWGITPAPARIKWQFPSRQDLGNMLDQNRTLTDNIGFIDGMQSPFWGPMSSTTELFTVNERYPAFQVNNPTSDAMANVMLNFRQRQYSYQLMTDKALVKALLTGNMRIKKYTMGTVNPPPMTMPSWLQDAIGSDMLQYTTQVMAGKV
jgi:hypothetical protein